ncbi:MAG: ribulose-phosphate 3-epimerase [Deltaproteobacteria bacterium]|nr:ribulose-phosphate 3-epimerase [Deltaproteobacteria bacterium]MBI3293187.1 ribulose-phosphate 3-epimerase [Deltaproteobacteria bacterium]
MKSSSQFYLAPSLLAADMSRFGEEIHDLEKGGADLFHFDIMDGHFVPNLTIGFGVIESLRPLTKLPFDAHLMIENADRYLEDFARVGCNWLSVHVEACPHIDRTLAKIRSLGMRPGVAINPGTSLASLEAVLDKVDFVLVMSVNPGFGGQSFIPNAIERVKKLRKLLKNDQMIEIDGGIKRANIAEVVAAGVDVAVMGTGLLAADDYGDEIRKIRQEIGR